MRKLQKSKYSFFVEKENGNYIAYSSLSGSVVHLHEEKYIEMLKSVLNRDSFEYEDNDFFNILTDNQIFVDENTDESLLVRHLYEEYINRSDKLEIMLIVTRQCNFRCVYCGQPHVDEKMDSSDYQAILMFIENKLLTNKFNSVHVTFFGGEPLIEGEKICDFLKKLKSLLAKLSTKRKEITFTAGMSTNGYLLTPKLFDKLIRLNCDSYQISIDGMSYTHDKMRPLASGKPSWERIIDNLKYMTSTNKPFRVTLRTNYNIDVAESLVEFYEFVGKNLKDDRINIYYETIKDHGNEQTPETVCGMEELVLDIDIAQLIKENGLTCSNTTTRLLPCSRICYASKPNHFIFDEKKQILKCSFALDSPENVIGQLKEDGTYSFNSNNYYNWVYNDYLAFEKCRECKALPLCFGKRCPKSIIQLGHAFCNTDIIHAEIEGFLNNFC
ncbi:MAG: radical SAM protein [Ruminococcaceae bacterium]|nr:radical SAM protein [Oscillospiraceae bacterium]